MKVILVAVVSANGKTTNASNPNIYHWTSKEDQDYFFSLVKKNNLLVMGYKTYVHAKPFISHASGKLRLVLTRTPQKFAKEALPNMLEFTNESPRILLQKLTKRGYRKMLLLGGSSINYLFLTSHVIDEIWLTIEPHLFGTGKTLFDDELFQFSLKLLHTKKLNKQGTLLVKYKIIK